MKVLEVEYTGGDLIISKEVAEKQLGLHPGDRLEIRLKVPLVPIDRSSEELEQLRQDVEAFRQAFNPSDLENWELSKKELWALWQNPT